MKGWLVTWEWTGSRPSNEEPIAAVLPPNMTAARVAQFVERLYALHTSTVRELAGYAKQPQSNPYKGDVSDGSSRVTCGHNPYLFARKVRDLTVSQDTKSLTETVSWIDEPSFSFDGNQRIETPASTPQTVRRVVDGPVCRRPTP